MKKITLNAWFVGRLAPFHKINSGVLEKDSGTIGLARWGAELYLGPMRAYFHALDQDAKGLIVSSPDKGNLLKVVVISSGNLLKVPMINISKEDGEFLFDLLESTEENGGITTEGMPLAFNACSTSSESSVIL